MSNQAEISTLKRLRGALKSKLTRLEVFLNKPVEQIDIIELKGKLTESEILRANFEEKQTQIETLVSEEDIDEQYDERGDFEDRFSAAVSKAKRLLITKEPASQINPDNQTTSGNLPNNTNANSSTTASSPLFENLINLKLPALNLPTFSGSYENGQASVIPSNRQFITTKGIQTLRNSYI